MTTADVNDSILITNAAGYYTLGHELYHILSQTHTHPVSPNLVSKPTADGTLQVLQASDAKFDDDKRLTVAQQKDIHDSAYANNPT